MELYYELDDGIMRMLGAEMFKYFSLNTDETPVWHLGYIYHNELLGCPTQVWMHRIQKDERIIYRFTFQLCGAIFPTIPMEFYEINLKNVTSVLQQIREMLPTLGFEQKVGFLIRQCPLTNESYFITSYKYK